MPEDSTTIHAKFFDINEGKITTTAEGWVNDGEKGTYTLKSEDEYNFESGQNIPIYFEFVGEKWFTFDYKLSLNTAGDYYGSLSVIVDGAKYLSKSFNAVDLNAQLNLIFKASGNTYHRVEIIFQTPKDNRSGSTSSAIPTALEFVLSNISLKNESEYETTQATVNWDAYLGEAYYISGILNTTAETAAEFIISKGTKIDNKDGKGTVTVPVGVPVAFAVKPYEKVTSRIDPDQQVNVHLDGIHYALGQGYKGMDLGTTGDELIFYFDAEGNVLDSGKTFKTEIYLNLREFAVLPKIFYTATIDNSAQEKKELHDKDDIELKYEQLNDILFEIEQNGFEKNEKFAMTINGEQASVISDGDMCGFTLNGIGENKDIVITPYYGEEFYPVSFEFSISMLLNGGIDDIILDSSADVSVENDEAYPWFFDPGRNSGDGYAFISGISYLDTITAPSFSQLKFTVVGNGWLTFEYHIDGYSAKNIEATNHNSWAAYSIGKKVYAAKCTTGTTTGVDWRAYGGTDGGFKKEIATNLGYGNSYMDYADVVTYYEPGGTSNSVKIDDPEGTKDRDKYWYKATIPIKVEQETEQTEIYIAHAIGVSSKPKCANMTVRNVAFYKGDVTVNWAVNNAEGSEGSTLNKINVTGTDKQGKVSAGTVLQFTAVPADNNSFYCWKNGDGEVLSYDTTYKVTVGGGDLDIRGIFDTSGTYAVRIDDKFYKPGEIENAFSDASSNKKDVIVVDNISLNGITIPAGVNLVIPYNRAGASYAKGTTDNATDKISWAGTTYKDPVYKLTHIHSLSSTAQ